MSFQYNTVFNEKSGLYVKPASFINIFRNKFVDNHLSKASVPERLDGHSFLRTYFLLQRLCDQKKKNISKHLQRFPPLNECWLKC